MEEDDEVELLPFESSFLRLKVPTGNSGFLGASSQDHTSSRCLLATQDFWGPVPKITQTQGAYWQLRIFGGQFPRSHKLKAPTGNSGFLGASSQDHAYWQLRIFGGQFPRSQKLKVPTGDSGFLGASSQDHTSSRCLLATQDFWGPVPKIAQAQGAYWQLRIFGGQFPRSHKLKAPTGNSGFLGASSQDHTSSRCTLNPKDPKQDPCSAHAALKPENISFFQNSLSKNVLAKFCAQNKVPQWELA